MRIESETLMSTVLSAQNPRINNIEMSDNIKKDNVSLENSSSIKEAVQINHKINEKTISKAVDNVNQKLNASNFECKFSVHKGTGQIAIKVMDKATGDVIKEIPSEKILDMVATALEMAGILMDEKR